MAKILILDDCMSTPIFVHGLIFDCKVDCCLRKTGDEIEITSIQYGDFYMIAGNGVDRLFSLNQEQFKTRHQLMYEDAKAEIQRKILNLAKQLPKYRWQEEEDEE